MKAAYYSETMARMFGYQIYKNISGEEIKTTEIIDSEHKPVSKWPDLKFVGFVNKEDFKSFHPGPFFPGSIGLF